MATVSVTYFHIDITKNNAAAVVGGSDYVAEVLTSGGSSVSTVATAGNGRNYVRIVSSGGNVYLTIGASPTAVTGTGIILIDSKVEFFALPDNYKVAIVN